MKIKSSRIPGLGILVVAVMLTTSVQAGVRYYVSAAGDDGNSGRSPELAWQSLEKVNAVEFKPGDSLLLESGSVFKGQLSPKGSGILPNGKLNAFVVDRYGVGPRPRIDGEGRVDAAVLLHNVEGVEIRNLEITNTGPAREPGRRGILVLNDSLRVARHIVLDNLFIHDVNGTYPKGADAGCAIKFDTVQNKANPEFTIRFHDILIENCHIKDCSRNGILIEGGPLRNNWDPSTQVVVRKNLIEGVGGDGIVPSCCEGALIEWNTMRDCPRYGEEGGAAAGIWPWSSDNTVLQFNEVSGHKAWVDGQAYDCDYNCFNTVYQYNYSHDNEGGFMLICSPGIKKEGWLVKNAWNKGSIIRYNLSINDGSRTTGGKKPYFSPIFSITGETTQDSKIYRNLFIVPEKADPQMDTRLLEFGNWGGKYPVNTHIQGNIFVVEPRQRGTFAFEGAKKVLVEDNHFYGDVAAIDETQEVESRYNVFLTPTPEKIPVRGTKEELKAFHDFLKAKGNPHEERGVTLDWGSL